MGRRSKKNTFKAFNNANVDEIEAKQKEHPSTTGNSNKSRKRQGNPIEKFPVPGTAEYVAQKRDDYLFSNDGNQYKEHTILQQTALYDQNKSENVGDESFMPQHREYNLQFYCYKNFLFKI